MSRFFFLALIVPFTAAFPASVPSVSTSVVWIAGEGAEKPSGRRLGGTERPRATLVRKYCVAAAFVYVSFSSKPRNVGGLPSPP